MFVATVCFFAMAFSFCYRYYFTMRPEKKATIDADHVAHISLDWLITAITIVVVAVPEGLPLAVTLALALSVKKMQ